MAIEFGELQTILQTVLPAVATWGAIKADIRNLTSAVTRAESSAEKAHARLDDHIEKHHTVK